MPRAVLFPKNHQINARALELANQFAPDRLSTPAHAARRPAAGKQPRFQCRIGQLARSGQAKPATCARFRLSCTVLRATPSIRPISRALTPSLASRNVYRICLVVSSLFAGIQSSSWLITRNQVPELLTQPKTPEMPRQVAGIKSEWWPASNQNPGRHQTGIPGRHPSESASNVENRFGDGKAELLEVTSLAADHFLVKMVKPMIDGAVLSKLYSSPGKPPFEASGTALNVSYLSSQKLRQLIEHPNLVTGVIGYGAERPVFLPLAYPFVATPLVPIAREPMFEVWTSASPSRPCQLGSVIGASNEELAFGAIELEEAEGTSLADAVEAAYLNIFDFMDKVGLKIPIRFWNYLTSIAEFDGELERYRCFNIGRHNAFQARLQQTFPPAASCVGARRGGSVIYFLAARTAATTVENPRQVSAYEYPLAYGPRSPGFSRASIYVHGGMESLFISGTASIVGHETRHCGDLQGQIAETIENLRALIGAAARQASVPMTGLYALKIYLQNPAFLEAVNTAIDVMFGADTNRLYVQADICRSDLLVEIEAFQCSGHDLKA